jgi:hypothetical protein
LFEVMRSGAALADAPQARNCAPRGFSLEINYKETWRHPCDLNLRLRL